MFTLPIPPRTYSVLYSSATGASEPMHLAYMSRLLAPGASRWQGRACPSTHGLHHPALLGRLGPRV